MMNFAPAQYANILFMLGGIKQTTAPTAEREWTVIVMDEYTNIETAMAIICDMCECLYPGLFCPEKPNLGNNLGKCDRRKHLEEDAADVAPVRHGRWLCGDYYDIGDVCSECDWDSQMTHPSYRYCPNCGAKMDKEE